MIRTLLFPALALFLWGIQSLQAQIADDFSDGNFNQNPGWLGDTAKFMVNTTNELQLNTSGAGNSTLLVSGNIPDSSVWDFEVRLGFDPSGSNLVRIFLQLDQADLSLANGYYFELGETGSADAIRFFRQEGSTKTLLAIGQAGLAALSPNLHFRVTRSVTGNWNLEAGQVGSALQAQFSLPEATWKGGTNRFFGFQCVYTASNATKFFFDNINIRPDIPDTQGPTLLSAIAMSDIQLKAIFNEDLDLASAENPANYAVNKGIGQPLSCSLAPDKRTVVLTLQNNLSTDDYTLQSNKIKDISGNESITQTTDFQYVKVETAVEFDLLLTEIMADPSPGAGLPEVEWFELTNRSAKIIDLATIRFADATGAPVSLPNFLLQPGAYVAITSTVNVNTLQAATSGKVLGLGISSSILNNESDVLTLSDGNGVVIDKVAYSVDWHTIASKENGGFSLERINIGLPCLGGENWQSCAATIGGTPATQNAAFSNAPDTDAPRLFKVFPESPGSILLTFSEGMDRNTVEDVAAYQFDPPISIGSASQLTTERAQVRLSLSTPLEASTVYTLTIESTVLDCSGNEFLFVDSVFLGLAETPEIQDIVINEILFNPSTGGSRYVEFYNRSQKIFDWSEFFLASNSDSTTSVVQISQDRLFLPGEYHVFCTDADYVRAQYNGIINKNVMQGILPSLDDRADSIKLYWAGGGKAITLDSFFYSRDFHNGLLSTSEQEGVSLERIRVDRPTQSASNWTSASPIKTGAPGTPTLPNSQVISEILPKEELIHIPVERFSPDGDGYEDFLEIIYTLPKEGYAASLNIFDSDGNLIKTLIRQNLIGTTGVVRWDGDTDAGEGTKTRPGIHVLYFEVFSPDGKTERVKKPVAVLGRF
jgi:hypothetical protein